MGNVLRPSRRGAREDREPAAAVDVSPAPQSPVHMPILTRSLGAAAAVLLLVSTSVLAQVRSGRPRVTEGAAQRLARLEPLIVNAMAQQRLPGAVVLVGGPDRTLYQKAFGRRAIVPSPEAMTTDTIFDVASLTKVVVTTTSVMMLLEQGQLGL